MSELIREFFKNISFIVSFFLNFVYKVIKNENLLQIRIRIFS